MLKQEMSVISDRLLRLCFRPILSKDIYNLEVLGFARHKGAPSPTHLE